MKTKEEWALEMHSIGCVLPYPYKQYRSLSEHVAAIQLDAMREGMRRAANVESKWLFDNSYTHMRVAAVDAILYAAEKLTEKDL